jgi:hypothetical protein
MARKKQAVLREFEGRNLLDMLIEFCARKS